VRDLHRPALGNRLGLVCVTHGGLKIVLQQELALQSHLPLSVGGGDSDYETQCELDSASFDVFHG
jgi:hypothetical protein